jgi:anti-sigma factor RsiW
MIPANQRELLTAAVDGELTPAERKAAERLLRESAAARALFAQLKADAARLRKLPKASAPADLSDNVLATIRDRAMRPTPLPPARPAGRRFNWSALPVWANIVTAAGVLLTITAGSYLYFAASHDYLADQNRKMAAKGRTAAEANAERERPKADPRGEVGPPSVEPETARPTAVAVMPRAVGPEVGPLPREMPTDLQTGPVKDVPEIESFQLDKIRVSHFFTPQDLPADEAARKKLTDEMRKDELIRLDLFCRSSPKALEMAVAALKARGVTVLTDAFASEQLKKKNPPEVMIFTEGLTPEEVTKVLTAVGAEDAKRAGDGPGELDTLVAAPFLPADLTKLSRLLGVPNPEPKAPKGKAAVDIRKPLPEGTASQLASSLSKLGSSTPVPPKAERVAIVVAYGPVTNSSPAASREIKQFLDRRGDRKPDAKPLMLVLRTAK